MDMLFGISIRQDVFSLFAGMYQRQNRRYGQKERKKRKENTKMDGECAMKLNLYL